MTSARAARTAAWAAVLTLVVTGVCAAFSWSGLLGLGVLAVSSPRTFAMLARLRQRLAARRQPARRTGVTSDPELLDRRFRELVARFDPDDPRDS
jgi:hypothetical protein